MRAALRRLAQYRQCELGAEKDAGQIDSAKAVPIREARLFEALTEKDAGIVDENVELAEAAGDGRDRRDPILLAGDVEMGVKSLGAGTLETPYGFSSALVQHIGDGDPRPAFDHQLGGLCADPTCCSGNQSDLAIESVHLCFLFPRLTRIASHRFGALSMAGVRGRRWVYSPQKRRTLTVGSPPSFGSYFISF